VILTWIFFKLLGIKGIQNSFWNDDSHYNNINWSHHNEEDIYGLEMPLRFNVGQELYVGMKFDSKNEEDIYTKVHQSFKVVEIKSHKYIVCCSNKNTKCSYPFYMRAILSKKIDSWKVTQCGWPHNESMTQDEEDVIDTAKIKYNTIS